MRTGSYPPDSNEYEKIVLHIFDVKCYYYVKPTKFIKCYISRDLFNYLPQSDYNINKKRKV